MNKMSMNESVAASCCWRYVLGVHEQYPEILHGGKIGTTYEVKLTLKNKYKKMKNGWLSLDYDVAANWAIEPIYYDPDNNLWKFSSNDTVVQKESVSVVKPSCPHNDGSCSYYAEVPTYSQDMHIGATSAHANLKAWDEPHKAVQYSS
ncbi:MAG TPA: hypothetical protein IAA66_01450, partial [Candidatus Avichristensenella intestinipullorum]|nr:hypothetical protein [Candidatus Avichristensenella intestinipullorum]